MKRVGIFVIALVAWGLLLKEVPAEAAEWAFSTSNGKRKVNEYGTVMMEDGEYQDMNLYRNGKQIKENGPTYRVKWYSSDKTVVFVDKNTGKMRVNKYGTMTSEATSAQITAVIRNTKTEQMIKKRFVVKVRDGRETPASAFSYTIANNEVEITGLLDETLCEIRIPGTIEGYQVTSIGEGAFTGKELVSVIIPDGVKNIGFDAFCNTGITEIEIPDSVTHIGVWAFMGCRSLKSVKIPASVVKVEKDAFAWCSKLAEVEMMSDETVVADGAFEGTAWLDQWKKEHTFLVQGKTLQWVSPDVKGSFVIPDGVMRIAARAFINCSEITGVVVPEGVISIGANAFSRCNRLEQVCLPSSLTVIEEFAFSDCDKMKEIIIPEGVTKIEKFAFSCDSLSKVEIPETLMEIGDSVFQETPWLAELEKANDYLIINGTLCWVSDKIGGSFKIPEEVIRIGDGAFAFHEQLTDVTIPSGVIYIGEGAFEYCLGLTEVILPLGITQICASAFDHCSGLTGIEIPEGVTSIGSFAFDCCTGLTSIEIPEGVTDIGDGAFYCCTGLKSVKIPESVTTIGECAFSVCRSLESITVTEGSYAEEWAKEYNFADLLVLQLSGKRHTRIDNN